GSDRTHRVDSAGLAAGVNDLRAGRVDGANVTMPHKAAAAAMADFADALVTATGAANSLRRSPTAPGMVEATNTDVGGLRTAAEAAGISLDGTFLVLGGGGAARAAVAAFGHARVLLSSRSPSSGPYPVLPWGDGWSGAVVVNATPLGMAGEALPEGVLDTAAGLIDMAYGATPTPAVAAGRRRGIPVADGLDVLVAQAAISFTWWTGLPAPLEVMQIAARGG
ncbi:MAG: hypothetical protein MUP76_04730, partial [Acidimicrobiia bacterium]|nr:hypothetical protein [Acidimicrobiia bacterium]